jgi:hypothetical protein
LNEERLLHQRASLLASLLKLEAFKVLAEATTRERERQGREFVALAMNPDISATDLKRQADYNRGYADGMRYVVVNAPEAARRKLEKIDRQVAEEEAEAEGSSDNWSYAR